MAAGRPCFPARRRLGGRGVGRRQCGCVGCVHVALGLGAAAGRRGKTRQCRLWGVRRKRWYRRRPSREAPASRQPAMWQSAKRPSPATAATLMLVLCAPPVALAVWGLQADAIAARLPSADVEAAKGARVVRGGGGGGGPRCAHPFPAPRPPSRSLSCS